MSQAIALLLRASLYPERHVPNTGLFSSLDFLSISSGSFLTYNEGFLTMIFCDHFPLIANQYCLLEASQVALVACPCRRHKRHRFKPWVGEIPWRRKWQRAPVLLPGRSPGQRRLAGFSPWGCKELDTTEHTPLIRQKSVNTDEQKII